MNLQETSFWHEYPKISEIEGEEVCLENPQKKEMVDTIRGLHEDEYLFVYNRKLIPERFFGARDFMTKGPEIKIKKVDEAPYKHFEEQLSRYHPRRPKRGFKWTKNSNRTSIFTSISSLIDGLKLFERKEDEIDLFGEERGGRPRVPSRRQEKKEKYDVFLDPLPDVDGKNWHEFFAGCRCKEHRFYGHSSKYINPECYICPHIIAGLHKSVKNFSEVFEEPIPLLFPIPSNEILSFDENLAKTFLKDDSRRRLYKGEREFLHSLRQGYYGNELKYKSEIFNL